MIKYIVIIILVGCACVCLSVCLSHLRYLEQETISPRSLNHLGELHLVSCTKCFSSQHDTRFDRKRLCNFFASYSQNPMHALLQFSLPCAGWTLLTTTKLLEHFRRVCVEAHALHITGTIVATAFMSMVYGYSTWTGYRYFAKYE